MIFLGSVPEKYCNSKVDIAKLRDLARDMININKEPLPLVRPLPNSVIPLIDTTGASEEIVGYAHLFVDGRYYVELNPAGEKQLHEIMHCYISLMALCNKDGPYSLVKGILYTEKELEDIETRFKDMRSSNSQKEINYHDQEIN